MHIFRLIWLIAFVSLGGCAAAPLEDRAAVDRREVGELRHAILGLGDGIDPEEAERAAQIAYSYSLLLAREYRVTDPPLIHNAKVHLGLRERGLCYHWAADLEARLLQEKFRTLEMHRAIAPETLRRIEHSTAVISRRGDRLFDGVILDPWRGGGRLHWAKVGDDTDYDWRPEAEVLDARVRSREARAHLSTMSP
jgi:hypothetical protein